jgi:thiamine-monophosphate kinase
VRPPGWSFDPGLAPGPETDRIRALLDGAAAAGAETLSEPGAIPPGDDAAAIDVPPGSKLVVSSDASVEGIHFRREWMTWEVIGYRATAAAFSDLAAMAAAPLGLLVSLAVPPELDVAAIGALGSGLGAAAAYAGGAVLGGDIVASPGPVMLDMVVLGHTPRPVRRGAGRAGDELWVTGRLGAAAAAVADLAAGLEPTPAARTAFERPRPRIREAVWLAARGVLSAAIDLSDGLARDARHLAHASGVAAWIEWAWLPIASPVTPYLAAPAGRRLVLSGGEDYEILFAAPAGAAGPVRDEFEDRFDVPITRVGGLARGEGLEIREPDGSTASAGSGYDHFQRS